MLLTRRREAWGFEALSGSQLLPRHRMILLLLRHILTRESVTTDYEYARPARDPSAYMHVYQTAAALRLSGRTCRGSSRVRLFSCCGMPTDQSQPSRTTRAARIRNKIAAKHGKRSLLIGLGRPVNECKFGCGLRLSLVSSPVGRLQVPAG